MATELYELLGYCGMSSKEMSQRRRLVDFAWQMCERKTPYVLDQLLTHAGVFTGIRILAIIAMFGYESARKIYPVLNTEDIPPPDRELLMNYDEDMDIDDIFPSSIEELIEINETVKSDSEKIDELEKEVL